MRISDWSSDVCSSDLTSSARVRRLLEQPRQMRGVRRDHLRGLGHFLRRFLQILEVGRSHRLADPIAGGDRGDRPADVVARLDNLRRDIVRAILVADDHGDADLRIARHQLGNVAWRQRGYQAVYNPDLANTLKKKKKNNI